MYNFSILMHKVFIAIILDCMKFIYFIKWILSVKIIKATSNIKNVWFNYYWALQVVLIKYSSLILFWYFPNHVWLFSNIPIVFMKF